MKRKKLHVIQLLIVFAALVVASGCASSPPAVQVGSLQTESTSVELIESSQANNPDEPDLTLEPLNDERLDEFTSYIEESMAQWRIPGAAVAVVQDGEIVYAEGFGVRELGKDAPVTPDTLFGIGSLSKSINAMLVATLVDEGFLEWDTPAVEIWPDFQLANPDATATVTVRDLLSQRTGMARDDSPWEGKNLSPEELMVALAQVPVTGQPGTQHTYENMGVAIAGYLGALAAGGEFGSLFDTYASLTQAQVFGPIGMTNSTVDLASMGVHPEQARGHMWNEAGQLVPQGDFFDDTVPGEGIIPAGGVATSANDMARYLITQLNRGVSPDDERVVSAANLTETWAPQISIGPDAFTDRVYHPSSLYNPADSQFDYGMGWFAGTYNGVTVVTHPGTQQGWTAQAALLPESDTGVVVLTNAESLPCAAPMILGVQYRLIELRYGLDNQIDGYVDQAMETVKEMLGMECNAPDDAATVIQAPDYQKIIDEVLQDDRPAIALRVTTPGFEVFETRGYADWENEIPLEKDHLSRIASVTKTFIATLTLMYHVEGKLNLDDTTPTYLPDSMTSHIQYADQITIRQLLNHTSGVFDTGDNPEWWAAQLENPTKEWSDAEALEFAYDQPAYFEPGADYAYSNTNYQLAGLILDELLGRHHSEELRSRILDPLGLSSTVYEQHEEFDRDRLTHGYFDLDGDGIAEDYHDLRIDTGHADGGLISTVEDMEGFITALFNNDDFPDAAYKEQFLQELLTIQPVASQDPAELGIGPGITEYDYGYGKGYGHTGGTPGYVANMIYFPEHDVTLTLTWNGFDGGFESMGMVPVMFDSLIEATFSALGHEKAVDENDASAGTPAGNVYEDPQGRFSMPLVGDWTSVETDGTVGHVASIEPPLDMYIVSVESADMEAGVETALQQVDIDPAALTETDRGSFGKWNIVYYSLADDQGAIVLAQIDDGTTHVVIVSGDFAHTSTPSDNLVRTVGGFALSGEVILPTTVDEFETFFNGVVGEIPPGLSIAIALGEDVIYANGFGMADGPREMAATPETVFQWGSVAKIATATAIMQLYEQGLIDLDAPVSDYLDYFPADTPITVRHLLNHSSGIPESPEFTIINIGLDGQPLPDPDLADRATYEEVSSTIFAPGSTSAYSNLNYLTLGQIIAAVSGQPYIEYVQEHILAPLDMKNTDFSYSSEAMISNAAAGAIPADSAEGLVAAIDGIRGDGADFIREIDETHAWLNRFNVMAAQGGLSGPVTELIRFLQMHLNGGELDGVRILSPESTALMQEMQLSNTDAPLGYGLGWEIFEDGEHPYIEHPGGGEGLQALTRIYLNEDFAVVLLSNATGYDHVGVVNAAANVIFSMLGGGGGKDADEQDDPVAAFTPPIVDAEGNEIPGSIATIETISLGGFEQAITLRGVDATNPVLLFLHGGPGVPSSPWATWNNFQAELEKNFVVVHWDQRGAGKSFSADQTADDMHMENFTADVLELTDLLRQNFEQEKIFLWGHSWGSAVGFETLRIDAQPFHAYIASGVRPDWHSTQIMGYEWALEQAQQAGDSEAIQALEALDPFDPANLEHVGVRGEYLSRYLGGDFRTEGLEDAYLNYVLSGQSPEYPPAAVENTMARIDFTRRTILLEAMQSGYDFFKDFPVSPIPVYFMAGRYDYETPGELAESYSIFWKRPSRTSPGLRIQRTI